MNISVKDQIPLIDRFDQTNEVQPSSKRSFSRLFYRRSIFRSAYQWILTHPFTFLALTCCFIPLILYLCLLLLSNSSAYIPLDIQQKSFRVLLIVAHPDDECLFFAPTLRVLKRKFQANLSVLVFSRGNHKGLGQIRAQELLGSCAALEIPSDHCVALDLDHLQDNPKVWWPENDLIPMIGEYVRKWSINFLVTFDDGGISGHLNHRAIASAVRSITRNGTYSMIDKSYQLQSVSLLRKYSGLMDFYLIFLSFFPRLCRTIFPFNLISPIDSSRVLLINTPSDYFQSRRAFASHLTQYSWDRHLYLLVSRYMFVNELNLIEKS